MSSFPWQSSFGPLKKIEFNMSHYFVFLSLPLLWHPSLHLIFTFFSSSFPSVDGIFHIYSVRSSLRYRFWAGTADSCWQLQLPLFHLAQNSQSCSFHPIGMWHLHGLIKHVHSFIIFLYIHCKCIMSCMKNWQENCNFNRHI